MRTGKAKLGASLATDSSAKSNISEAKPINPDPPPQAKSPELTAEETRQHAKTVEEFVQKVGALEREIQPLVQWATQFVMSTKREDTRKMVQICQVNKYFELLCSLLFIILFK